jgi:hypothetical protein
MIQRMRMMAFHMYESDFLGTANQEIALDIVETFRREVDPMSASKLNELRGGERAPYRQIDS